MELTEMSNEYTRAAERYEARLAAEAAAATMSVGNKVVALKPKVEPLGPKIDNQSPRHMLLGGAVLHVIKKVRGEDIMFTEKAAYRYADGIWSMEPDGLTFWLNREIELAANRLNISTDNKLINETRGWIRRQEALCRRHDEIPWDEHGMVPTKSGLVNPRTLEVRPIQSDDYCTWRIEAEYDPDAKCPWWERMLQDVFADRDPKERASTISVIQEILGAGLIDDKPRELSKALILLGGSNFGKSGVLEVAGGLFGKDQNATPIEALEGAHGLMGFLKRRPWVLHEAFDQRKWHFSSVVKTIITGEPIHINIKNGPMLSQRVTAPPFWGTNHPPQFKESTKAIANRLVVIECKREFFDDNPVGAAKEAFRRGLGKPSNLVLKEEMPGLLAWAMAGLKRALERGRFVLTKQMSDAIEAIRLDSNMVSGFLEECCSLDFGMMVSSPDFCLAFSAYWQAEKGETYSPPSNDAIGKALAAMAEPRIALGRELRDKHRRYYPGLVLNEVGLTYHAAGSDSSHLVAKTANTTCPNDPKEWVNKPIPESWITKPEIIAMRKACGLPTDAELDEVFEQRLRKERARKTA
jgi:P4 family phage/plasmid primase-like protien